MPLTSSRVMAFWFEVAWVTIAILLLRRRGSVAFFATVAFGVLLSLAKFSLHWRRTSARLPMDRFAWVYEYAMRRPEVDDEGGMF